MKIFVLLVTGFVCFLPVCMNLENQVVTGKKLESDVHKEVVDVKGKGENPKEGHIGEKEKIVEKLQDEEQKEPVLAGDIKVS